MISELPTRAPLEEFDTRLKSQRSLPAPISDMIGALQHAHPMEVLRTCVSALGAYAASRNDNASEAIIQKGIRLTSQLPMIVAAHNRIRNGNDPVEPDVTLNHAAHFFTS